MTRAVATTWTRAEYVANGRRTLYSWPEVADCNSRFLAAEWRSPVTVHIGNTSSATSAEFPVATPGQCRVRIPPWCKYVGWAAVGDTSGSVGARRFELDDVSDVGSWALIPLDVTASTNQLAIAYHVDTSEPANQVFGALHTNVFDGAWHDLTVQFYCDTSVGIWSLQFFPMPASYTNTWIGT